MSFEGDGADSFKDGLSMKSEEDDNAENAFDLVGTPKGRCGELHGNIEPAPTLLSND